MHQSSDFYDDFIMEWSSNTDGLNNNEDDDNDNDDEQLMSNILALDPSLFADDGDLKTPCDGDESSTVDSSQSASAGGKKRSFSAKEEAEKNRQLFFYQDGYNYTKSGIYEKKDGKVMHYYKCSKNHSKRDNKYKCCNGMICGFFLPNNEFVITKQPKHTCTPCVSVGEILDVSEEMKSMILVRCNEDNSTTAAVIARDIY
jgi:hypothetical protein